CLSPSVALCVRPPSEGDPQQCSTSLTLGPRSTRALHSLPTRRSSDLAAVRRRRGPEPADGGRDAGPWLLGEPHRRARRARHRRRDRKSTRLNSSHAEISYAVFWLKKNTFSTEWMSQSEKWRTRAYVFC